MLIDDMAGNGRWLFRWRAYLPLALLPLVLIELWRFRYPYGDHSLDLIRECVCFGIAILGLALRITTVGFVPPGTSARSTKSMEAEKLNTTGMYSVVRHPLYLGNLLMFTAILLCVGSWHLVLIGVLAFWLYYERIMLAEETLLDKRHDEAFRSWARRTPAILPRLDRWRSPDLSFSIRRAIRGEYTTFFLLVCSFTAVELVGDWRVHDHFEMRPFWGTVFFFSMAFYLVVRFIKKRTRLLDVARR